MITIGNGVISATRFHFVDTSGPMPDSYNPVYVEEA